MKRFGFLLLPQFSHLSFASMTEPMRIANRLSEHKQFEWVHYCLNDAPTEASDGLMFHPHRPMSETADLDALFVVSGLVAGTDLADADYRWLRGLARAGKVIGSTSSGSYVLANAGVLRGRTCTVHWSLRTGFAERFPSIFLTNNLYEFSDNRWTCSGGAAGLDFVLEIIRREVGPELAKSVAEQCVHPQIRSAQDQQQMSPVARYNIHNARLAQAVSLMESNIESPMTIDQIASRSNVSKRHLERLFDQHLGHRPARFYTALRLGHAQTLLRQTTLPVTEVAILSGFSTTSYFTRRYKAFFSKSPKDDRVE
ncbi:helix-turn-helix domain-containing protein [Litorivicinus lipolyticus]|jgi:transcriptional regulator GlxA family with amidase domain|uniref:Helix-turn-helix domain-containing protein n=1 Tax=Litorivicinus lipolyticus TaxID=418701 RepID=A0A5Q2QAP6_9GAMM|nr:GlxA family transcriptional regulator [Litorivicinus lipolyticus]QGG79027.1 helix-turn-helix domain-containing protein [Litorivicinus lipolyticus]